MDCEVAEWSAWAQCDAATAQEKRTRPIVAQPEGGKACPRLEQAKACNKAINSFLHLWDWALGLAKTLLLAKVGKCYLSASVRAQWTIAVVGGVMAALAAAVVFVAHNETVCARERPFFGRAVLCDDSARLLLGFGLACVLVLAAGAAWSPLGLKVR